MRFAHYMTDQGQMLTQYKITHVRHDEGVKQRPAVKKLGGKRKEYV